MNAVEVIGGLFAGNPLALLMLAWLVARVEMLHRKDAKRATVVAKLVAGHTEGREAHAALADTLRPEAEH